MTDLFETTIAAIATARGEAGVAVIRVSGAQSWAIARSLFNNPPKQFEAGRFYHGWIVEPEIKSPVDEVLLLVFKGPHSFTGEDVIEIQCHGGDYVSHKILNLCVAQGAVMASPGEFSKRAFLNGKMDLTQAESVMDLVQANNNGLLTLAGRNLKNRALGSYIDDMRESLIQLQTDVVASVDFPDEVEEPERNALCEKLQGILDRIDAMRLAAERNQLMRDGYRVAIMGLPNAGKSSIFNALVCADRAIVTEVAGTTRDTISETITVKGIPVELVDTAGIRQSGDQIETLGVERTWQAATDAHAVLYVYDATQGLMSEDEAIVDQLPNSLNTLLLANKIDLLNGKKPSKQHCWASAKTGGGIPTVFEWIENQLDQEGSEAVTDSALASVSLNQRQTTCLQNMQAALVLAKETLNNNATPIDLVTVPLTDALLHVDALMGRDTREEVLDSVFSQFCVGK